MRYLLIGDLHLTATPRDAYRFGIFRWVRKMQAEYEPDATIFMGDITDKKDKHPSVLVNRIVSELSQCDLSYVIMGNHDYVDPENPFFRFLGNRFIYEPTQINRLLFIPHIKKEADFERVCRDYSGKDIPQIDYVLCHQTFEGAIAENGMRLNGFRRSLVDLIDPRIGVYAGDIHKPQRAANVVYVGAPYHIRFGDPFDPRCILLDGDNAKNLYFDTVRKWSLSIKDADDILNHKHLFEGDQIKVTLELAREEATSWRQHRRDVLEAAKKKGLEVFGVDIKVAKSPKRTEASNIRAMTPDAVFTAYCTEENLASHIRKAGRALLGD